jgi:hypothetical protein
MLCRGEPGAEAFRDSKEDAREDSFRDIVYAEEYLPTKAKKIQNVLDNLQTIKYKLILFRVCP